MLLVINRPTVVRVVLLAGAVGVFYWWRSSLPPKARPLELLAKALDGYKAVNGIYPTSCVSFVSFSELTHNFSVYTGEHDTNGVAWQPQEVSRHDFTVLVDRMGYEIFLPVGRMIPISFSSFPVWRYGSADHQWQKGRIHWSVVANGDVGSYWSEE